MDLQELVTIWTLKYKFDRLYRIKHNIRFGSKEHRDLHPLDMVFAMKEDAFFEKLYLDRKKEREALEDYKKTGDPVKLVEDEQLDSELDEKLFDDLDITQINGNE